MKNPHIENKRLKNISSSATSKSFFRRSRREKLFAFLLFILLLPNAACENQSLKANVAKPQTNAAQNDVPVLERDLQTMRDADFDFVYLFRRKDGAALDSEDKKYLKANSPVSTNRFILTDENKAVIAGSSYKFEPENLDNLQKRFAVENLSKPESQQQTANQNRAR